MRNKRKGPLGQATWAIHGDHPPGVPGDPVIPPEIRSSTFMGGGPDGSPVVYGRYGNAPTVEALGRKLALMEGTESAIALSSGMAAISLSILALVAQGDHVVSSRWLYGATHAFLTRELPRRGVESTLVDPLDPRSWKAALRRETRLLYLEMPANPTLRMVDPRPIVALGQEMGIPVVMDATFGALANFRPVRWGVDVVVHSATKYLGGHSDLVAGVVAGSQGLVNEVEALLHLYGPALDPHAAWLLDRGLRTLEVRVERQCRTALSLARWFKGHPAVAQVLYPGLPDHPDHHLAQELLEMGGGGMLGVVLKGGGKAADAFVEALGLAALAPSLGGVETLVSLPRLTSHRGLSPRDRQEQGIDEGFVRVSIGLEDEADLRNDFAQALAVLDGAS
ncbi:MAG: aminotransferase class I/II-fold pyridoxal phosphate-dependent enzyme [Gemmatimonadota bacterium]